MSSHWIFDDQWSSCMQDIPSPDIPIVMTRRRCRAVSGKAAGRAQTCRSSGKLGVSFHPDSMKRRAAGAAPLRYGKSSLHWWYSSRSGFLGRMDR
jgi:hypothetical protein